MKIQTVNDRSKLPQRADPYWLRLSKGCYLGFRKTEVNTTGTWLARYQPDSGKREFKSLSSFDSITGAERFDAASKAAMTWFEHMGKGGANLSLTIQDVCQRYIDQLRATGKASAATDAARRFNVYVLNDDRLAKTDIQKLTQAQVIKWRKSLADTPAKAGANRGGKRTDSSLNRDITPFRSALNAALHSGFVSSSFAWERPLLPIADADGQRDVYLDTTQRKALAECAPSDLATLIQAMSLLPVRPGAMARLKVSDFDGRINTLRVQKDKTVGRTIALPPDTAMFFEALTTNKQAVDYLLTRDGGKAWDKDSWKKPFKAAAKTAGLTDGVTLYALRHSVITDLVHRGLDLLTVGQVSGTSQRMIEKHYGHLVSEQSRKALSLLSI